MPSKQPEWYQLAIAIMAVATAAIGFGLFGSGVEVGPWVSEPDFARGAQLGKVAGILASGVFYLLVLLSVARFLQDEHVTGRQLVFGPLQWLFMEMTSLGGLFFVGLLEELAGNLQ